MLGEKDLVSTNVRCKKASGWLIGGLAGGLGGCFQLRRCFAVVLLCRDVISPSKNALYFPVYFLLRLQRSSSTPIHAISFRLASPPGPSQTITFANPRYPRSPLPDIFVSHAHIPNIPLPTSHPPNSTIISPSSFHQLASPSSRHCILPFCFIPSLTSFLPVKCPRPLLRHFLARFVDVHRSDAPPAFIGSPQLSLRVLLSSAPASYVCLSPSTLYLDLHLYHTLVLPLHLYHTLVLTRLRYLRLTRCSRRDE